MKGSQTVLSCGKNLERCNPMRCWTSCTSVGQAMSCTALIFSWLACRPSAPSMCSMYLTLLSLRWSFFSFNLRPCSWYLLRSVLKAMLCEMEIEPPEPNIFTSWITVMFSRPSRHLSSGLWNLSGAELIPNGLRATYICHMGSKMLSGSKNTHPGLLAENLPLNQQWKKLWLGCNILCCGSKEMISESTLFWVHGIKASVCSAFSQLPYC